MDDLDLIERYRISPAEMERRRQVVRRARAHSRLEGIPHSPGGEAIFEAYIRGEITAREIVPRLKEQLGLR